MVIVTDLGKEGVIFEEYLEGSMHDNITVNILLSLRYMFLHGITQMIFVEHSFKSRVFTGFLDLLSVKFGKVGIGENRSY